MNYLRWQIFIEKKGIDQYLWFVFSSVLFLYVDILFLVKIKLLCNYLFLICCIFHKKFYVMAYLHFLPVVTIFCCCGNDHINFLSIIKRVI